jgi:hypothetical protein
MWKRTFLYITSVAVVASLTASCIFDPEKTPGGEEKKPPPSYEDLSEKDHVLFNLQLLYPQYDWQEYNKVLDDDLVFFFSKDDIEDGIPFTEFAKADEIRTLRNMGDTSRQDRVLSINLTLSYSTGEWTAIVPEDPKYAGETWFQKTVVYNMTVQAEPNMTYVSTDIKAQFTIREGEDQDGSKIWRIIRWRDAIEGG